MSRPPHLRNLLSPVASLHLYAVTGISSLWVKPRQAQLSQSVIPIFQPRDADPNQWARPTIIAHCPCGKLLSTSIFTSSGPAYNRALQPDAELVLLPRLTSSSCHFASGREGRITLSLQDGPRVVGPEIEENLFYAGSAVVGKTRPFGISYNDHTQPTENVSLSTISYHRHSCRHYGDEEHNILDEPVQFRKKIEELSTTMGNSGCGQGLPWLSSLSSRGII